MTKAEVYRSVIEMHKKTGQGVSGIVTINNHKVKEALNELIEEGLVKACNTGGSIGHPESNIFYISTKGYNVWEDHESYEKYSSKNLSFVRFYLGLLNNEKTNDIEVTNAMITQNLEVITDYREWLNRNNEALETMKNLDSIYCESIPTLSESEINEIKKCSYYKNNNKIIDCLQEPLKFIEISNKQIQLHKELIALYKTSDKYQKDLKDSETEIKELNDLIFIHKRINKWLMAQNQNIKIQKLI